MLLLSSGRLLSDRLVANERDGLYLNCIVWYSSEPSDSLNSKGRNGREGRENQLGFMRGRRDASVRFQSSSRRRSARFLGLRVLDANNRVPGRYNGPNPRLGLTC